MSRNEVDNEHLNEFITNLNIVGHQVGVPGPILDQFKTSLVQLVASRQNSIKIDENKQSKHELDLATDCFLTLRLSGLDLAPNRDDDQTRYEINNGNNNNDDVDLNERNLNEKTENNEYHPMRQQQNDDINFDNKFNNYNIRNNHNNDFNVEHSNNHNANNNNAFCNDGFNGNRSSNNHNNAMYNNNSDFNNQDRYYNHNVNHYVNPKYNNNNNASPMMYTSDFNNQYRHSVNPKGVNNYNTNARSPMYNSEFNNQEMFKDSDSPHYLNNTDLTKYNNNNINYNKDNNNIIPTNIPPNDIDTPEAREDDFNSNNHNDKIIAGKEKYNNKDLKGKCCSNKICCFDLQSETSDINNKNERLRSRTERNLAGRNRFSKAIYSRKNNNNNNYSNMINNRGTTDAESTYNGDDVEKPSEKLEIKTFASEALRELGDMQKELMRKISKRNPKKRPVAWEKKNKNNGRGGRDLSYLAKDKNNKRHNFRRNGNDNLSSNNRKKAGQDSEKFDVLEQAERDKFKKDFYRVRNRDGKQTRQTEFTLNKLYNGQDSSSSESTYVVDNSSSYLKKRMKNNNRMTSSDSFSSSDDDISSRDIESLIMLIEDLKGELLVLVKTNLPLLKMKISIIRKRFTEIIRNEL